MAMIAFADFALRFCTRSRRPSSLGAQAGVAVCLCGAGEACAGRAVNPFVMAAAAAVVALKKKAKEDMPQDIVAVFEKYDEDHSGDVGREELDHALRDLEVEGLESDHVESIFALLIEKRHLPFGAEGIDLHSFELLVSKIRQIQGEPRREGHLIERESLPHQRAVNRFYESRSVVLLVAALILANFIVNIIEAEVDPGVLGVKLHGRLWDGLDAAFNIVFLLELLVNMYRYGGPRWQFWVVPWNVFDTIIVTVGVILILAGDAASPQLKKLKLLRAFRVIRALKRVESLNHIVTNLMRAMPAVLNSFLLMLIVFSMYAVLGVDLFHEHGVNHTSAHTGLMYTYTDDGQSIELESQTARGVDYGWEYYGTFARSMYTLFQIMTGDSWSEAVVRPLIFGWVRPNAFVVALFFVSFILITNMVLMNVVVAALLDKFVESASGKISADELVSKLNEKIEPVSPAALVTSTAAQGAHLLSSRSKAALESAVAGGSGLGDSNHGAQLAQILLLLHAQGEQIKALHAKFDAVVHAPYTV
jgi:hypothetical protein